MNTLSIDELLGLGFESVGDNPEVSTDARFFTIRGSLGNNVRIDAFAILTGHIELHDQVHISPQCFLSATGGAIRMHRGSGIGPQVAILTKSDDYTVNDLAAPNKLTGDISIGEHSIIGAGGKILPGVTIGNSVSIGSNCVISNDVNDGQILVSRGASVITVGSRLDSAS